MLRDLFPQLGESLVKEGVIAKSDDVFYVQIDELYQIFQATLAPDDIRARIEHRKAAYKKYKKIDMPERFVTTSIPSLEKVTKAKSTSGGDSVKYALKGLVSSPGTVEGIALVLDEPVIPSEPYDILIARHTDPGWTPLIALAKGVIVEHGGMLSHAAIVTRELGIPSIIGVSDATAAIKTGMKVRINSQSSRVEILDK